MTHRIDWVFFDVGSVLMDETSWIAHYQEHVYGLLRERCPHVTREMLDAAIREGNHCADSITIRYVLDRFVPDPEEAIRLKRSYWQSAPPVYFDLGRPAPHAAVTLETLSRRYRLGIIANQHPPVRRWLEDAGLAGFFSVMALDCDLGVAKPDPRLFRHALDLAGCPPERAVMVGDRLDNDIAPAKALGMRTIRYREMGEYVRFEPSGPDDAPDATVTSLAEIPGVLASWEAPQIARETPPAFPQAHPPIS